jgi:hypothetical protein
MLGTQKKRLLAVAVSGLAAFGLVATATNLTGAYFSEAKGGNITGTVGAVHVDVYGGSGPDHRNFSFTNLLPGEPQTITISYTNTGTGPEDIHLNFPNRQALHALNNLGSYGSLHIADSSSGPVFDSANLQDGRTLADLTNSCTNVFSPSGCWPLPSDVLVRTGLPAGASGSVKFTFAYDKKLGDTGLSGGGVWNSFPSDNPPYSQAYGDDATGDPGAGLPYQVVATQAGHPAHS